MQVRPVSLSFYALVDLDNIALGEYSLFNSKMFIYDTRACPLPPLPYEQNHNIRSKG
jgi:hypothetical protein